MTLQPRHTVLCNSGALLWCAFTEKYESGWGGNTRNEGWARSSGIWKRGGEMSAATGLSLVDLLWICAASALFRHERVLCWFLPDDGSLSYILLHVTYKILRGDLNSTHIPIPHPLCHHSYVLAASPPSNIPITSNLYQPNDLQQLIILTVEHIWTPPRVCTRKLI